ncbi:MAG: ABC transporter permease [Planctomycetes bacterium]|nr:ABC transporter permease [Planctomycetota bacterium]
MYRVLLAIRYLLARPINLLGVAGIALGVWALIVVPSIFSGYLREVGRHLQSSTADLSIVSIPADVPGDDIAAVLRADPDVRGLAPRIVRRGMLHPPQAPARSRPPARGLDELVADAPLVTLLGIDPDAELAITGLGDWLRMPDHPELRVPDPTHPLRDRDGRPTILLSRQRLERDGFAPGGTVAITIADGGGEASDTRSFQLDPPVHFTIGGAFESSFAAFDGLNVFAHIDTLRELTGTRTASEFAVRLRPGADPDRVARRIEREIASTLDVWVRARTWAEENSQQLDAVAHQRGLMQLVLWVIMLVAGFVVYATLSMMVTEKTRDIGTLSAMGADSFGVASVFVACGTAVAVAGAALGSLAGVLTSIHLDDFNSLLRSWFDIDLFPVRVYNLRHVPYAIEPQWIATVSLVSIAVCVLVAGIPAWRAARLDPIEPLRYE